ncbi:ceruloplasmin-like [Gastrophryne carolinensis]
MKLLAIYLLFVLRAGTSSAGKLRTYWFGIQEINWDYAPSGKNIISGKPINEDAHARIYLQQDFNRIGKIYKKAVYYEYTNDLYTEKVNKPEWMGFLGPLIKAEIGDTIIIHLKNFASRPYSLHPHGVRYNKAHEGAYYPDNTSGELKADDYVKPGESHTYEWEVVEDQGPTASDDDCIIRIYHSHIDSPKDISAGLMGPMMICKKGALDKYKQQKKEEFFLMFFTIDENASWYIDKNIAAFCSNPASVDKEDADFQKSNFKHSINGYMFGNLPGLSVCENTNVIWYLFAMGNEVDLHSVYFHGQVLTFQHRRVDTLSLLPASMVQASMLSQNPGKWLLTSQVNIHFEEGMQAIYEVRKCPKPICCEQSFKERHHYIAALEIIWNYGPNVINQFTGQQLDTPDSESAKYFVQNDKRIGGSYKKAVFREFTDSSFTKLKPRYKKDKHLGILGPLIVAEVGDTIKITFQNKASHPYSIQAHGVSYIKEMEGARYNTGNNSKDQPSPGSQVNPGHIITYEWKVPNSVGPTNDDLNCIPWLYYSSVDVVRDTNSGLVGPILVCKSLTDMQVSLNHNFFLMPTIFDENKSWYLKDNIEHFTGNPASVDLEDPDFIESNIMHAINGYMYGNQPGLDMCLGDSVVWHMLGLGSAVDIHGIHFTGNTVQIHKTTRDVASVSPHISYSAVMSPDNKGVFNVECMTADHYIAGMRQQYRVEACNEEDSGKRQSPNTVTYYVAAEEIEWDYSPNRTWENNWHPDNDERYGDIFLNVSQISIGSKYKKAVYRAYTDHTFKTQVKRSKGEQHLGILGPLILANVGDRIKIVFQNKAKRPYSIYAHGLKQIDNKANITEPGNTQTYVWDVPERSGPNNNEIDCLTWAYYSNVDHVKDIYSGLIGPIVICKKIHPLNQHIVPVIRFALLFMVFNENESWYLDENIQTYSPNPNDIDTENEDFIESNKMHSINGKMYANLNGLTMHVGDHIVWHIIGMGNEVDIHTIHFHGHSLKYTRGSIYQSDVFELFPGTFQTVSMIARSQGDWLLHCHVDDHMHAGMVSIFTVLPSIFGPPQVRMLIDFNGVRVTGLELLWQVRPNLSNQNFSGFTHAYKSAAWFAVLLKHLESTVSF